jgi:hypothetical protein
VRDVEGIAMSVCADCLEKAHSIDATNPGAHPGCWCHCHFSVLRDRDAEYRQAKLSCDVVNMVIPHYARHLADGLMFALTEAEWSSMTADQIVSAFGESFDMALTTLSADLRTRLGVKE